MRHILELTSCLTVASLLCVVDNVISGPVVWQQGCRNISSQTNTTIIDNHPGACLDWCETHNITTNYISLMGSSCFCLQTDTGTRIGRCQANPCEGNPAHFCGNKNKSRVSLYKIEQRNTAVDTSCILFKCPSSIMFGNCSSKHTFASYSVTRLQKCRKSRGIDSWIKGFHNKDIGSPEDQCYDNDTGNSICTMCQHPSEFWIGGFGKYAPEDTIKPKSPIASTTKQTSVPTTTTSATTPSNISTTQYKTPSSFMTPSVSESTSTKTSHSTFPTTYNEDSIKTTNKPESATQTIIIVCSVSAVILILILITIVILVRRWCKKKNQINVEDEAVEKSTKIAQGERNTLENFAETALESSHIAQTKVNTNSELLVTSPPADTLITEAPKKLSNDNRENQSKIHPSKLPNIDVIQNVRGSIDNTISKQVRPVNEAIDINGSTAEHDIAEPKASTLISVNCPLPNTVKEEPQVYDGNESYENDSTPKKKKKKKRRTREEHEQLYNNNGDEHLAGEGSSIYENETPYKRNKKKKKKRREEAEQNEHIDTSSDTHIHNDGYQGDRRMNEDEASQVKPHKKKKKKKRRSFSEQENIVDNTDNPAVEQNKDGSSSLN